MTMKVIQHIKLGSAQSSITFTSIPQTFTDLMLVISARNSSLQEHLVISLNGSTASFNGRYLNGQGNATPGSGVYARYLGNQTRAAFTANTFGNAQVYIPNYASSTGFKSLSSETVASSNDNTPYQVIATNVWSSNDPITSLSIVSETGSNFAQFSSATLYGITRGTLAGVTVS